jgi:hypothetical protein
MGTPIYRYVYTGKTDKQRFAVEAEQFRYEQEMAERYEPDWYEPEMP